MTPSRRTLLGGLLATLAAPAIIRTPGLLMPVRVVRPKTSAQVQFFSQLQGLLAEFPLGYQYRLPQGIRVMRPDGQTTWHKLMPS